MTDSILDSIKKQLNIPLEEDHFDTEIVIHINSALATLHQLGVGPEEGFEITSNTETWANFIGTETTINSVKTLVYLKVRLIFDTPTNSFTIAAFEKQIEELQWRLNVRAEEVKNA